MDDGVAIRVENVSKTFKLPHEKTNSIKGAIVNFWRRDRSYEKQIALDGISFEINKGEFFGIVGKNGGGKSTLLKVIAGIYSPSKGKVYINGKLTPFIELGVGFNPDLTGRENIYLNGALFGFSRKEMSEMYDSIVKFAELERFMDQKLKNYSSGMQVRLAFSIAIRVQSDIVVLDEVLAVGDAAFQKKCVDVFRDLKKRGRTIVLVTHDMSNVEKFCDRVLVLDKGKQIAVTTPNKASAIYAELNIDEKELARNDVLYHKAHKRKGSGKVMVKDHKLLSQGKETTVFRSGEKFVLEVELSRKPDAKAQPIICGLSFHNDDDIIIAGPNTINTNLDDTTSKVTYEIEHLPLSAGEYRLTLAVFDHEMNVLDLIEKWIHFTVISDYQINGLFELAGKWSSE